MMKNCVTCQHAGDPVSVCLGRGCSGSNRAGWEPISAPVVTSAAPAPAQGAGMKFDGGKPRWSLLMRGCGLALAGVVAVLTFGAQKYAADSWQEVEEARTRYREALYRHLHEIELHGPLSKDPESGLLHWFHVACNALFLATFAAKDAKAQAEKETH